MDKYFWLVVEKTPPYNATIYEFSEKDIEMFTDRIHYYYSKIVQARSWIYWSTTNLWTWGQQFYVIKRNPTPGSPAWEELQAKKAKKAGTSPESSNTEGGSVATEEPKPAGQRQQPKTKKKKWKRTLKLLMLKKRHIEAGQKR